MVVRLRLQRFGQKNGAFYRIVAADARAPRDGRFIELVGSYNPVPNKEGRKEVRFNGERVKYWLGVGAQPSKRVAWLLGQFGLLPPPPVPAPTIQHLPKKERRSFCTLLPGGGAGADGLGGGGAAVGLGGVSRNIGSRPAIRMLGQGFPFSLGLRSLGQPGQTWGILR